jgi:hypothetical protein
VEGEWECALTQYNAHDMDINSVKWNPQVGELSDSFAISYFSMEFQVVSLRLSLFINFSTQMLTLISVQIENYKYLKFA